MESALDWSQPFAASDRSRVSGIREPPLIGRTFGVDPGGSAAFNLTRLEPMLADIHERLTGVTVECLWS